jgi:hypothetical protein
MHGYSWTGQLSIVAGDHVFCHRVWMDGFDRRFEDGRRYESCPVCENDVEIAARDSESILAVIPFAGLTVESAVGWQCWKRELLRGQAPRHSACYLCRDGETGRAGPSGFDRRGGSGKHTGIRSGSVGRCRRFSHGVVGNPIGACRWAKTGSPSGREYRGSSRNARYEGSDVSVLVCTGRG